MEAEEKTRETRTAARPGNTFIMKVDLCFVLLLSPSCPLLSARHPIWHAILEEREDDIARGHRTKAQADGGQDDFTGNRRSAVRSSKLVTSALGPRAKHVRQAAGGCCARAMTCPACSASCWISWIRSGIGCAYSVAMDVGGRRGDVARRGDVVMWARSRRRVHRFVGVYDMG